MKHAVELSAPSITHTVNISMKQGKVTNELKFTKVMPMYKKGGKIESTNHRTVSALNIILKVLEIVVYNQIYKYIQGNDLF